METKNKILSRPPTPTDATLQRQELDNSTEATKSGIDTTQRSGKARDIDAKRLKNASSGPKITEGRRMTASGKCARTPSSPNAFDLA